MCLLIYRALSSRCFSWSIWSVLPSPWGGVNSYGAEQSLAKKANREVGNDWTNHEFKMVKLLFFFDGRLWRNWFFGNLHPDVILPAAGFFPLLFLISFIGNFIKPFESYFYDILKIFLPNLSYDYVTGLLDSIISQSAGSHYSLIVVAFFFSSWPPEPLWLVSTKPMAGMKPGPWEKSGSIHSYLHFCLRWLFY